MVRLLWLASRQHASRYSRVGQIGGPPPPWSTSRGGHNGFGTSNIYGNTNEWFVSYGWLPVNTLLDTRVLVISIAALPDHRSGIRVDAQVTWLPAKPAGDRIPGGEKS